MESTVMSHRVRTEPWPHARGTRSCVAAVLLTLAGCQAAAGVGAAQPDVDVREAYIEILGPG